MERPSGKELKETCSQHSTRSWDPLSNSISWNWILPTIMWGWNHILPQSSLQMRLQSGQHLNIACERPWAEELAKLCPDSLTHRNWNVWCFKLLHFMVICYIATDKEYTPFLGGKLHILVKFACDLSVWNPIDVSLLDLAWENCCPQYQAWVPAWLASCLHSEQKSLSTHIENICWDLVF